MGRDTLGPPLDGSGPKTRLTIEVFVITKVQGLHRGLASNAERSILKCERGCSIK
jgi:hypothetical protein